MSKTLAPSVTHRDPKGLKFLSIVESAYDKARLSKEEAQHVNDTPGLAELIGNFITENRRSNQYAREETHSNYTYPPEYKGPKPIEEQIEAIAWIFELNPKSAFEYAKTLPEIPGCAEGWFAIPSVEALAKKHFPAVIDSKEQYCNAVRLIHTKLASSRSFYNYREGQITPDRLQLHPRTEEMIKKIAETQKGDILIIAAQLGMRHRGCSVRRAREVFTVNEFGLGSVIEGSILLTHPERFVRWEELQMDASGDMFVPEIDGRFVGAPCFRFYGDGVEFDTYGVGYVCVNFGSASGFLPQ